MTAISTPTAPTEPSESAAAATRQQSILVVCQSPELRLYVQKGLSQGSIEFITVSALGEARDLISADLARAELRIVLLEIPEPLEPRDADAIQRFCAEFPALPVVGIAPRPSADLVRAAMVRGVCDFLTNPFHRSEICDVVRAVMERTAAAAIPASAAARGATADPDGGREAAPAQAAPGPGVASGVASEAAGGAVRESSVEADANEPDGSTFVTGNARMLKILEVIERVAPTDSTVLVLGESGTGKEIIARRIHRQSQRIRGPFVEVHCGAIPSSLLESQLFGHEKGSFTGAFSRQIGLFEIADRGTIFLDEIAEMSLEMQVKLLRVLQERTFRRIGGRSSIQVDVRVVAATNRDLTLEVEEGRFRADLFYRLNVICLEIPPLRARLEDIPRLVDFFIERLHTEKLLPRKKFSEESIAKLQKARWVGNVRELENTVERLVLLSAGDTIGADDVEEQADSAPPSGAESPFEPTLTLDEIKKIHIAKVLHANEGNKMRTARVLGINVKTLYNLIQRLGIATD